MIEQPPILGICEQMICSGIWYFTCLMSLTKNFQHLTNLVKTNFLRLNICCYCYFTKTRRFFSTSKSVERIANVFFSFFFKFLRTVKSSTFLFTPKYEIKSVKDIKHNKSHCSDPHVGGGTIYTQIGFFLLRKFWPIDIFIVESWDWYH